jgi:hypothetical protein
MTLSLLQIWRRLMMQVMSSISKPKKKHKTYTTITKRKKDATSGQKNSIQLHRFPLQSKRERTHTYTHTHTHIQTDTHTKTNVREHASISPPTYTRAPHNHSTCKSAPNKKNSDKNTHEEIDPETREREREHARTRTHTHTEAKRERMLGT